MSSAGSMPIRSWIALVGLSLLAFGIFTLVERLEKQAKRERVVTLPPVDYRFSGVDYSALDNTGRLRIRVQATDMTHARVDKSLILSAPKVLRFADDAGRQTLIAARAQVFDQGKRVFLDGQVNMQSRGENASLTFIKTADLTLLSEEKRAFSDGAVEIQQGSTKLTGRGLRADFSHQEIEIEHDVHTVFLPPAR
jgi:LPS export ABC transporter protein LptC